MSWIGGETDLVVDNNVNGTMSGVVGQVGQMHCLEHNALAAECGVAVQKYRHDL